MRRRAATLKPSKPAPWSDETTHAPLARIGSGLAALTLAATLQLSTAAPPAAATELDVLKAKVPNGYIIDDGKVFSRATSAEVTKARRLSACARRVWARAGSADAAQRRRRLKRAAPSALSAG